MSASLYSALAPTLDASYEAPSHRRLYDQLAWRIFRRIELPAQARIIDVGCGGGRWARQLCALGHHVTGLEQAPGMIDALRSNPPGETFTLVEGDMLHTDLGEGVADAVIALGSLQYSTDPARTVQNMARWLRPGGVLFVHVDGLLSLAYELIGRGATDEAIRIARTGQGEFRVGEHSAGLTLFDRSSLKALMTEAGMSATRILGLGVQAGIIGRRAASQAMAEDEQRALAVEDELAAEERLADAGLHLLAVSRKPA